MYFYCKCGKYVSDNDKTCKFCGSAITKQPIPTKPIVSYNVTKEEKPKIDEQTFVKEKKRLRSPAFTTDSNSFWFYVLGFIFPLVSFILYFLYKDSGCKKVPKKLLIGILTNVITTMVISFILSIIYTATFFALLESLIQMV